MLRSNFTNSTIYHIFIYNQFGNLKEYLNSWANNNTEIHEISAGSLSTFCKYYCQLNLLMAKSLFIMVSMWEYGSHLFIYLSEQSLCNNGTQEMAGWCFHKRNACKIKLCITLKLHHIGSIWTLEVRFKHLMMLSFSFLWLQSFYFL